MVSGNQSISVAMVGLTVYASNFIVFCGTMELAGDEAK